MHLDKLKVFVTGGTGFIGLEVVKALLIAGHDVLALSRRTGTELDKLRGVQIVQGSLREVAILTAAATAADAVMHLAFDHDFARFDEVCAQDTHAISAVNKALAGSGKLFVMTSGTGVVGDTGDELFDDNKPGFGPRAVSEHCFLQARAAEHPLTNLQP